MDVKVRKRRKKGYFSDVGITVGLAVNVHDVADSDAGTQTSHEEDEVESHLLAGIFF